MLNALKTFAVFALLAFGVIYIFASSLDFQNCVYEYGKANPDAKYLKEGVPVFIRSIPIYRYCVGDYVTSKHDVITAAFTIVIAVFTTVLAIFTISLAGSTRIAANAAKQSVEATRDIMRLDQRAWLGVDNIRAEPTPPEVGKTFTAIVSLKNSGKTPARHVIGSVVADPVPQGGKPNFSYEGVQHFSLGIMPPNTEYFAPASPVISLGSGEVRPVTPAILQALLAGEPQFYVHGRLDYEDIFGAKHWLTFCYLLSIPYTGKFQAFEEHNETDDHQLVGRMSRRRNPRIAG